MLDNYHIVLASNSPRRKALLTDLGIPFEVRIVKGLEESYPSTLQSEEIPQYLSRQKAEAYLATMADNDMIITADTVVVLGGLVLGKPANEHEAHQMLTSLSGRTHEVITGITITTKQRQHTFAVKTKVTFCTLSEEEINHYIQHYHPLDKAGSYGIQEWIGYVGVEKVEGSYFNVVGLPIQQLYQTLKHWEDEA
ncbi:MAG: Maf family nucleotide pyrophosphatase [Bacteroidales bacterium]|nr:Maf family nucleotide pyrophosphatase [Bacteroidales bacterium]